MRLWLGIGLLFGAAFLVVRAFEFAGLNVRWDSNAYGSVVWLLLSGVALRTMAIALPIVGGIALTIPGVGSRLATLATIATASEGGGDPSVVGRLGALRYGTAMFYDHAVLGVGPGNFIARAAEYQRADGFLFDRPKPVELP